MKISLILISLLLFTSISFAMLIIRDLPTLTKEADMIIIGTAEKIEFNNDKKTFTKIKTSVEQVIKPSSSVEKSLCISLAGGLNGNEFIEAEDEAVIQSGERMLVFLTKDSGRDCYTVTEKMQGKFTIRGSFLDDPMRKFSQENTILLKDAVLKIEENLSEKKE
jgi:hypothetical protein